MTSVNVATAEISYLKLNLGVEMKAVLPMAQIQEVAIISKEIITPIPCMPNYVLGLINQRSRVIWVIDLGQLLGIFTGALDANECGLVVLRINNNPLGLIVPSLEEVITIADESLLSSLDISPGNASTYLSGYLAREGLYVLDGKKIINIDSLNHI